MTAGLETTVADAIRGEEQPVRSAALIALVLLRRGWFVLAATILMTTQPFLTTMSKNSRGGYDYLSISITLIVEIVKGLISLTLYALLPASRKSHRALRRSDVLLFAIPAVVYAANNNLIFAILAYVNATTYQVLSSLKTLFTAVLFRLVLKRLLSDVQVAAVVLLACGAEVATSVRTSGGAVACVAANASALPDAAAVSTPNAAAAAEAWMGVVLALLACALSAFGGVYSELLLKKDGQLHSIHLQNLLLYAWGVGFNALALLWRDRERLRIMLLIVNNALVGLAISAILKFANNLVRIFAHTAAMLLTMLLECAMLGAPFSPQLATSIAVVACATYLFNVHPPPPTLPRAAPQRLSQEVPPSVDEEARPAYGEHAEKTMATRRWSS